MQTEKETPLLNHDSRWQYHGRPGDVHVVNVTCYRWKLNVSETRWNQCWRGGVALATSTALSSSASACYLQWAGHYFVAPSCGWSLKKVSFMHHSKHGVEKLLHVPGVCFSSSYVPSLSLCSFWNQSCPLGMGFMPESIMPCLHQKPQRSTKDDKGKTQEYHP